MYELSKKNDDLRELNMTLSHAVSDLRLANKNLESEKASLLTALKLIQDDCTWMTETAYAGEKTTKPNKCNSTNYPIMMKFNKAAHARWQIAQSGEMKYKHSMT